MKEQFNAISIIFQSICLRSLTPEAMNHALSHEQDEIISTQHQSSDYDFYFFFINISFIIHDLMMIYWWVFHLYMYMFTTPMPKPDPIQVLNFVGFFEIKKPLPRIEFVVVNLSVL